MPGPAPQSSDVLVPPSSTLQTQHCLTMPNVFYVLVAIMGVILFVTLAGFNKLAQMDLNPATKNLDSYAHPS